MRPEKRCVSYPNPIFGIAALDVLHGMRGVIWWSRELNRGAKLAILNDIAD